jgi:DNA-binding NtrC family response regulator
MADLNKIPKRMLVVDDERSMRDLLAEYLNEYGYEVACAENGQDALKMYNEKHFDIILSDLNMAPMNGLELLNKVKEIDPDAIFIMITGYPSISSSIEAIKKGARDYITKPFNIDEIRAKVERALLEKSTLGRLRNAHGIVWALIISIPVWLGLGIILARMLME